MLQSAPWYDAGIGRLAPCRLRGRLQRRVQQTRGGGGTPVAVHTALAAAATVTRRTWWAMAEDGDVGRDERVGGLVKVVLALQAVLETISSSDDKLYLNLSRGASLPKVLSPH